MSLVAYDSSDDSDSNEIEDVQETPKSVKNKEAKPVVSKPAAPPPQAQAQPPQSEPVVTEPDSDSKQNIQPETGAVSSSTLDPHISDEEDDFMLQPQPRTDRQDSTFGMQLPAPKATAATSQLESAKSSEKPSLLLGLPQPKSGSDAKGKARAAIGDDTLEEMVKPKAAELELAAQLKPPGKKKAGRQLVKITIPALPDPDSDEDEPQSKRPKPSDIKSGLFSLLPAPKFAQIKQTNRPLIPHTLTRKPASTTSQKKAAVPPKKAKPSGLLPTQSKLGAAQIQDEDSDDDDAAPSTNFFSLGDSEKKAASYTVTSSLSTLPSASAPDVGAPQTQLSAKAETQDSTVSSSDPPASHAGVPSKEIADAPLEFKKSFSPPVGPWGAPQWGYTAAGSSQGVGTSGAQNQEYLTNQQYNYANLEEKDYPEVPTEDDQHDKGDVDMEQLLRLQGRSRGSREQINIIDVHADEQVSSDMDLTKTLTQESETMMSHSTKKNKDMPSGQQKRKHQITYLAFKAKERETLLKNQWAESRESRKHTQSKYGF